MKENTIEIRYLYELADSVFEARPPTPPPKALNWETVCGEALRLSMQPFLCYALERLDENDRPDISTMAALQKKKIEIVLEESEQQRALTELFHTFDEYCTECLLCQQLSLKNLYPYPDLRYREKVELFFGDKAFSTANGILQDSGHSPAVTYNNEETRCYRLGNTILIIKKLSGAKPFQSLCESLQKYKHYENVFEWQPEILCDQLIKKSAVTPSDQKELAWLYFDFKVFQRFYQNAYSEKNVPHFLPHIEVQ